MTTASELEVQLSQAVNRLRIGPKFTPYQASAVLRALEEMGVSLVTLRHAAWMNPEDHSVTEVDTDEDYVPSGYLPLWQVGRVAFNVPSLNYLEDGDSGE